MRIVDLPDDDRLVRDVADLLVAAFKDGWPEAWPDRDSAIDEVRESLSPGRVSRIALDRDGRVLGWIGAIPLYDGNVWEIHPLAVRPGVQRRGIGSMLVADLERLARDRGVLTLWVGTDDETSQTSLGGQDLYPNVLEHLLAIENRRNHPFEFYQKLGFVLAGIVPDANGRGKPDILMAKRVQ